MTGPPDPWHEALQQLSPELIEIFGTVGLSSIKKVDVLAAVLTTAKEKRNLCLRNCWKFKTLKGEVIILRDVVEKIVTWVEKFIRVGDTAMQYDPAHAALPWAAVRFLLQATVSDVQLFGATCLSLERISRLILRYRIFEDVHLHGHTAAVQKLLDEELVKLYSDILMFLGKSILYLKETAAVRALKGITRNSNYQAEALQKILEVDEEILRIAGVGDSEKLQRLEAVFARISDSQTISERKLAAEQHRQFLGWLSSAPFSKHHRSYSEKRVPLSGQWLADHPVYRAWRTSSSSSILLLHGIRGSGKSTLASVVIDLHLDEMQSNNLAAPMGYFYCAGYQFEPQRSSPDEIMRSIVRQLTSSRSTQHAVRDSIWSEYEDRRTQADIDGFEIERLNVEACVKSVLDLAATDPLTIIIDAVDEIQSSAQHVLLQALSQIARQSDNVVKVMITSRNNGHVFAHLSRAEKIGIQSGDNSADMKEFVSRQVDIALQEKRLLKGVISEDVRNSIESMLIRGSGEMFLWAELQLQYLCGKDHPDDIVEALDQRMSTTLDDMYSECLDGLLVAGSTSRAIVLRLLSWLLYAAEPLSPEVLLSLIAENSSQGDRTVAVTAVTDMCAGLVIIDKYCHVARFAHQSVQDFIKTQDIFEISTANRLIATSCLSICIEGQPSDSGQPSVSTVAAGNQERGSDAYTYASMYWAHHAGFAEMKGANDKLFQQLTEFCFDDEESTPSLLFLMWLETVDRVLESLPNEHSLKGPLMETASSEPLPFFTACIFGLTELVRFIFHQGAVDPNTRNARGQTGIYLASVAGHTEIVQILLDHGADAEIPCGRFMNAIQGACFWGHTGTAQVLLQAKVSPRVCGLFRGPLEACYRGGHEDLALILLRDAAVIGNEKDYSTALQGAAEVGFLRAIDWLQSPAVVKRYGQPFPAAGLKSRMEKLVKNGNVEALKRFLGPDTQDALFSFSVATAATYGREAMVRFLLDKDMSIEEPGPIGSPLRSACLGNHQRVIRLLLQRGAKLDEGGTSGVGLQAAAMKGHVGTVKLLLQEGAQVNQPGPPYGTALQAAAWCGHTDVLELLIDAGAHMRIEGIAKDALHAAAEGGHAEIVKVLLSRHFRYLPCPISHSAFYPPSNPYTDFEQPQTLQNESLEKSAAVGYEALVRLLLQHRKDLMISDYNIGVAFSRAAMNGHLCVVAAFLELEDIRPHVCRALACTISHGSRATVEALFPQLIDLAVGESRRAIEIGIEAASDDDREARLKLIIELIELGSRHCQQKMLTKLRGQILLLAATHQVFQVVDGLMNSVPTLDEDDVDIAFDAACETGHVSVVRSFLEYRQHEDRHLYITAGNGNDAVIRVLLERGCSKTTAERALVLAAANGHTETVRCIIGHGTDVNCTALLMGARPGQPSHVSPLQAALRGYLRFYGRPGADEPPRGNERWFFHPKETLLPETRSGPTGRSNSWRQADENQQDSLVMLLLDLGADPNDLGGLERSPIQEAAEYCPENIVARLLEAGADLAQAYCGPSALEISVRRVQLLNEKQPMESHRGCEYPHFSGAGIAQRLIEASVADKVCGSVLDQLLDFFKGLSWTPVKRGDAQGLYLSDVSGRFPPRRSDVVCMKLLFQDGPGAVIVTALSSLPVDVDIAHNPQYGKVLQMAAEGGESEVVRLLLRKGLKSRESSANLLGRALIATSRYGHPDTARILLEANADPNHVDTDGSTALECAVTNQHAAVVQLLLRHSSEHVLIRQAHETYITSERDVRYLGRCKVLEARRPFGFKHLLYVAARNGDASTVKYLLQAGARCKEAATDAQDGPHPLLTACISGSMEAARHLLMEGAPPNVVGIVLKDDGVVSQNSTLYNPIHLACRHGHIDIIQLLLEYGAHVDGVPQIHRTPLVTAAGNGNIEVVRLLLSAGAQVDLVRRGKTALSVAVRRRDTVVADALLQAGTSTVDVGLGIATTPEMACVQDRRYTAETSTMKLGLQVEESAPLAKALSLASKNFDKEMFETLFKYSNRPINQIRNACRVGSVAALQQMANDNEGIFDRTIKRNQSALQVVASYGHCEAVKFLYKKAASRQSPMELMQTSGAALITTLEASVGFFLQSLRSFLVPESIKKRAARLPGNAFGRSTNDHSHQLDVDAKIKDCWRAAEFLIDSGAPCHGKSPLFGSTLKMAIMARGSKIARRLLAAGVDPKDLDLDKSEASMVLDPMLTWLGFGGEGMIPLLKELGISNESTYRDAAYEDDDDDGGYYDNVEDEENANDDDEVCSTGYGGANSDNDWNAP